MPHTAVRRRQHHFKQDRRWLQALDYALQETLGLPRESGPAFPDVRMLSVSNSGTHFEVELRFRPGETYCCCEPEDFLATWGAWWWRTFRAHLAEVSDREPPPMSVTVFGAIENGARFEVYVPFGLPRESEAFTYRNEPAHERDAR
jgi:hypothetical protein